MSDENKLSAVEAIKEASRFLRGTIAEDLQNDAASFAKDNAQLLKFHGTYQQDDREQRVARDGVKSEKAYSFMVRTRIPGGDLTAEQFLAHLDLCDEIGNTTLKVTTRQAIQLHGILKGDLWKAIHRINEVELSTLAACGDVNRNVMCCPAPYANQVHHEIQKVAHEIAMHLAPRSKAYHELWVTDPQTQEASLVGGSDEEYEPIYGKTYLPRKFKIGVGLADDNCVDIYTQDLGFMAIVRDQKIIGYNVTVGGGMGMTPSATKTFPALAKRMAFCTREQVLEVAEAVVKVQRDHGNRSDRKVARLKYVIADKGVEWFRERVEAYCGYQLADCHPDDVTGHNDHLGWEPQGDGLWFYGLNIENGRVFDGPTRQWKSAIREICHQLHPRLKLTAHQSILFTHLREDQKSTLESILRKHGIPLSEEISTVRRWSIACVALPTCGLAITESERVLPEVIDQLELILESLGLEDDAFTIRMTGCPNGCARPFDAEVGLVGRAKGKYTLYLGGSRLGNRLGFIHRDMVPLEDISKVLHPLLSKFSQLRQPGEGFGDFCTRVGNPSLVEWNEPPAVT
jgi:sulfite reductase (ferredoxin)